MIRHKIAPFLIGLSRLLKNPQPLSTGQLGYTHAVIHISDLTSGGQEKSFTFNDLQRHLVTPQ